MKAIKSVVCCFIFIYLITSQMHAFSFLFSSRKVDNDMFTIGVVLQLTGKDKELGEKALKAIMLVLDKDIADNVLVKIYDTHSTNEGFKKLAKDMQTDGIKIIVGPVTALDTKLLSESLAAIEYNVPILSFSNNVEIITGLNNTFLLGNLVQQEISSVLEFALFESKRRKQDLKLAAFVPNNSFGDIVSKTLQQFLITNNITDSKVVKYPANEIKLSSYFQKLIPEKSLKLYVKRSDTIKINKIYNDPVLGNITKAPPPTLDFNTLLILEFGRRIPYVSSLLPAFDLTNIPNLLIIGPSALLAAADDENLQGAYFASSHETLNGTTFFKLYRQMYSQSPSNLDSVAYDSINIALSLAKEKGINSQSTSAELTNILIENFWPGVSGDIKLLKNGLNYRDIYIKQIVNYKIIDASN